MCITGNAKLNKLSTELTVAATFLVPGPKIEFEATSEEYKGRGPPQDGCEGGANEKEQALEEALPTCLRKRNHTQKKGSVIHEPRLLAPRWTLFLFLSRTEGVWGTALKWVDRDGQGR